MWRKNKKRALRRHHAWRIKNARIKAFNDYIHEFDNLSEQNIIDEYYRKPGQTSYSQKVPSWCLKPSVIKRLLSKLNPKNRYREVVATENNHNYGFDPKAGKYWKDWDWVRENKAYRQRKLRKHEERYVRNLLDQEWDQDIESVDNAQDTVL